MNQQHTHYTLKNEAKQFPIHIIADGLNSPANIGSLCRLMDSFGLQHLWLCNAAVDLNSTRLKRTARATQQHLTIHTHESVETALAEFNSTDFYIVTLDYTTQSKPINEFELPAGKKLAIILGNERYGVSKYSLEQAQQTYHIPMYGHNSSMNVIQAASIALYAITQKLL